MPCDSGGRNPEFDAHDTCMISPVKMLQYWHHHANLLVGRAMVPPSMGTCRALLRWRHGVESSWGQCTLIVNGYILQVCFVTGIKILKSSKQSDCFAFVRGSSG